MFTGLCFFLCFFLNWFSSPSLQEVTLTVAMVPISSEELENTS